MTLTKVQPSVKGKKFSTDNVETTTSVGTLVALTTPTQVSITLDRPGLVYIYMMAFWKCTVAKKGLVTLYRNSNPLYSYSYAGTLGIYPGSESGGYPFNANTYSVVATTPQHATGVPDQGYMLNVAGNTNTSLPGANKGLFLPGGPIAVFMAAGTHTISAKFAVLSASTLTVSTRRLYVWSAEDL